MYLPPATTVPLLKVKDFLTKELVKVDMSKEFVEVAIKVDCPAQPVPRLGNLEIEPVVE